jgi:hypothetical protein
MFASDFSENQVKKFRSIIENKYSNTLSTSNEDLRNFLALNNGMMDSIKYKNFQNSDSLLNSMNVLYSR